MLDLLSGGLDDPAEAFAQSFRLTGRLHRRQPQLSKVLLHNGPVVATSDKGLARLGQAGLRPGVTFR